MAPNVQVYGQGTIHLTTHYHPDPKTWGEGVDGCLETDNTVQVLQMLLEQFKSKLENVAKVSMMQLIFSSPTHDWSSLTKPWSFSSETMSLFVHYFAELLSF